MDHLVIEARAIAQGLKDCADHCGLGQDALRARLLTAAAMIVRLIHRIERQESEVPAWVGTCSNRQIPDRESRQAASTGDEVAPSQGGVP
jgi:hypothetical protein